jgi:uncharacterized integral membrane protein
MQHRLSSRIPFMRARTLILVVLLAALGLFAAINWQAFVAPTPLSLIVTRVQAPLGIIMLAFTAAIAAAFLIYIVYMQTGVVLELRRQARALEAQRELADSAEASRFTELREYLARELSGLRTGPNQGNELQLRLDKLQHELREEIHSTGNTLAAYIGELEERLEGRESLLSEAQRRSH